MSRSALAVVASSVALLVVATACSHNDPKGGRRPTAESSTLVPALPPGTDPPVTTAVPGPTSTAAPEPGDTVINYPDPSVSVVEPGAEGPATPTFEPGATVPTCPPTCG